MRIFVFLPKTIVFFIIKQCLSNFNLDFSKIYLHIMKCGNFACESYSLDSGNVYSIINLVTSMQIKTRKYFNSELITSY